jgi:hypothetical protein
MPFKGRAERRRWERIPVEMLAELLGQNDDEGRKAEVIDLSWSGARIRGEGLALKRGDSLDLVIIKGRERDVRPVRLVWVKTAGRQAWVAGLEFVMGI